MYFLKYCGHEFDSGKGYVFFPFLICFFFRVIYFVLCICISLMFLFLFP